MALEQFGLAAILDDKNFQAGMERYKAGIAVMSSVTAAGAAGLSKLGEIMKTALVVGAGLAVAAIGAVTAAMKIGIDAAGAWQESVHKFVMQFGVAAPEASAFAVAMNHVGLTVDEGAMGLNYLTRQLDALNDSAIKGDKTVSPFGKALASLGVSAFDSQGKLKTFEVIMPEMMDAFAKLPEGVGASALAMDLFGARGGSKFIEFMQGGTASLVLAREEAKKWGLELSNEDVEAVEMFKRSMNDMGLVVDGIKTQFGLQLGPVMKDLVDFITTNALPAFVAWSRVAGQNLAAALRSVGSVLGLFFGYLQGGSGPLTAATETLNKLFGTGQAAVDWARDLENALKAKDWERVVARLGDLAGALGQWLKNQIALINWGGIVNGIGSALGKVGGFAVSVAQAIADKLEAMTPADWDRVVFTIGNSLGAALGLMRIGAEALGALAQSLGDALGNAITGGSSYGAGKGASTWVGKFKDSVISAIKGIDWGDAREWLSKLNLALGEAFQALGDTVGKQAADALWKAFVDYATGADAQRELDRLIAEQEAITAGPKQPLPPPLGGIPPPPVGTPTPTRMLGRTSGNYLMAAPGQAEGGGGLVESVVALFSDPNVGARVMAALSGAVGAVAGQAGTVGAQIAQPLMGGLVQGVYAGLPQLTTALNTVVNVVKVALSGFYGLGVSAMNGLISGMRSRQLAVQLAIVQIIASAISIVKSLLGISSPSKVFAGIGQNMAMGLAQGWTGGLALGMPNMAAALGAMQPVAARVPSYRQSAVTFLERGGGEAFNNYGNLTVVANDPAEFHRKLIAQMRIG